MSGFRRPALTVAVLLLAGCGPAHAEAAGDKLLARAMGAMAKVTAATGEMTEVMGEGGNVSRTRWRVDLKKPNLARLKALGPTDRPIREIVCDGKRHWETVEGSRFTKRPADPKGRGLLYGHLLPEVFFDLPGFLADLPSLPPHAAGQERELGATCDILEFRGDSTDNPALKIPGSDEKVEMRLRLWLTPEGRIVKVSSETTSQGKTLLQEAAFTRVRWDAPPPPGTFVYRPPKGAKPYPSPLPGAQ